MTKRTARRARAASTAPRTKTPRIPQPRLHKPSGQARIRYQGRDVYLGRYGSDEASRRWGEVVSAIARGEDPFHSRDAQKMEGYPLDVCEVIDRFWQHALQHYRHPDGRETSEISNFKAALRPLEESLGHLPARAFNAKMLKTVRDVFVDRGCCRRYVNHQTKRIRRVFKWAVSEGLIPPEVLVSLQALAPLQRGRSKAKESEPVRPVPDAHIEAVLPHLPPLVRDLVELQLLTGARPGELLGMRPCDLDTTEDVWLYRPPHHKNAHRGHERTIFIGSKGQAILKPHLAGCGGRLHGPLFSPRESEARRYDRRHQERKTPLNEGNSPVEERWKDADIAPGETYTTDSYRRAIHRACRRAKVPLLGPGRLRHNAATRLRKEYGVEVASVLLGHRQIETTQIYAEKNTALARKIAGEIG